MVDQKLVATTVSSRDVGMQRRIGTVTTSSHEGKKNKKDYKKQEETSRIHISFKSKDSKKSILHRRQKRRDNKENGRAAASIKGKTTQSNEKAEAVQIEATDTWRTGAECSGSSKVSPQTRSEELQDKTTFILLQKNTRSMNSSERREELFSEIHQVAWDVILISETWRQGKEIWETQQGHIMVESGKFTKKHGVAILLNRRLKNQIKWVQCACERVVAMSISVNKQPIVLMSVYMPHSGYPDHQVEKTYKTILTTIEKDKSMKIIGGDFNAEIGPGEGIELSAVGHYTLNKTNCRGEWMTQWLLENKLVAVNTMYKKLSQKPVTYHTPKKVEKQLDYILTDKKHYSWSRDAKANDTWEVITDVLWQSLKSRRKKANLVTPRRR